MAYAIVLFCYWYQIAPGYRVVNYQNNYIYSTTEAALLVCTQIRIAAPKFIFTEFCWLLANTSKSNNLIKVERQRLNILDITAKRSCLRICANYVMNMYKVMYLMVQNLGLA